MNYDKVKVYCLSKPGAYQDTPFGPFPICFKVGELVVVGYHCPDRQKPYKNTVYLNLGIEDGLIYDMIDHSYEEAVKRQRKRREG